MSEVPVDDGFEDDDIYCDCGACHTIDEIDYGHCECCGGIVHDEGYS